MAFKIIVNLVLAAGVMLEGAQSQIVAAGNAGFITFVTIAYSVSNYLPGVLPDAHGACPTLFMASHAFKM